MRFFLAMALVVSASAAPTPMAVLFGGVLFGRASAAPTPWGSPTVGRWTGALPSLPQTSAGFLPHSPMLGNGYMGAMLTDQRPPPTIVPAASTRGPGAPGNTSLHVYLGSNAFWGVYPATNGAVLGPTAKSTRRAVGGLTLSGLAALFTCSCADAGAEAAEPPLLAAEQRVVEGKLTWSASSNCGTLNTTTFMSPTSNVLVLNVSWTPVAATRGRSSRTDAAGAGGAVLLAASVWGIDHYPGVPPGGDHSPGALLMPTSAAVLGDELVVVRDAVPANLTSPRRIRAALALSVRGAKVLGRKAQNITYAATSASESSASASASASATATASAAAAADGAPPPPATGERVAAATGTFSLGAASASSFSLVVTMSDNLHDAPSNAPASSRAALAATAAAAAAKASVGEVGAEAREWWQHFWSVSRLTLPTEPEVEALWNGAQYISACSMSDDVDAGGLAPGLGGPFVTSDNSGWNGDYTLDYNYEAAYYGVYASGHPELAALYFQPMIDGMAAATRGAQVRATMGNLTCMKPTALHYNAHISPWGYGDMDEGWETKTGQEMHWNGIFGALLFFDDLEYLNRSRFFKAKTLPLLEGLLDWWSCYLTRKPCPASKPNCADGYVLSDQADAVNEGHTSVNSQIALAFIARLCDVLKRLPHGTSSHSAEASRIAAHLAPFNTAQCTAAGLNHTIWTTQVGQATGSLNGNSDFAAYPVFPSQFLSTASATAEQLAIAQATIRVYGRFSGRPVEVFPAVVAAGRPASASSALAWTPEETVAGFKTHMQAHFGSNLLCDTEGGGIENVGMSKAVSEMLVSAPSGKYITLFPFWPQATAASFRGLLVKGGFRLAANRTAAGVASPFSLRSINSAVAEVVNPWLSSNVTVSAVNDATGARKAVAVSGWKATPAGRAFSFAVVGGEDRSYVIAATEPPHRRAAPPAAVAEVACTAFKTCAPCMAANDTRKAWASPCVFLSGPSEGGARCEPSKWWFPPYNSAVKYPTVHACAKCPTPSAECPELPPPPPGPPAAPGACPLKLDDAAAHEEFACGSTLRVAPATGAYSLSLGGAAPRTVVGAQYAILFHQQWFTSNDSSLILATIAMGSGTDSHGSFRKLSLDWTSQVRQTPELLWRTSFKCYTETASTVQVIFAQTFPDGLDDAPGGARDFTRPSSAFPAWTGASLNGSGVVTFIGANAGKTTVAGTWPSKLSNSLGPQGAQAGPIAFVNPASVTATDVLVVSPITQFMASMSSTHDIGKSRGAGDISWGTAGLIHSLPPAYNSEFVAVISKAPAANAASTYSGAVAAAYMHWGDALLRHHGTQRTAPDANVWVSQLGYSTTGVFHYNPCDCKGNKNRTVCPGSASNNPRMPGCHSYSDSLMAVHNYSKEVGIPYRWNLIDSWWHAFQHEMYFEDIWQQTDLQGAMFPDGGLTALYGRLGEQPFAAHWSSVFNASSPYRLFGNNSLSENNDTMVPLNAAVWDNIFTSDKRWGLDTIKVDHLFEAFIGDPASSSNSTIVGGKGSNRVHLSLLTSAFDAETFLLSMAEAAERHGTSVMWCMSFPNVLMSSVMNAAMTHGRSSSDSHPNSRNFETFAGSSTFSWAVGLWPFKDTFYTNTSSKMDPTGSNIPLNGVDAKGREDEPWAHLLVAALSGGGVAPGDVVGGSDAALIRMSCRADGLLLKPSNPATYIDKTWKALMNKDYSIGEAAAATVLLGAQQLIYKFVYVLPPTRAAALAPVDVGISSKATTYVQAAILKYNTNFSGVGSFSTASPLKVHAVACAGGKGCERVQLYVLAPVLANGWTLLGETTKVVTVSAQRIAAVATTKDSVSLTARGSAGERVQMAFLSPAKAVVLVSCSVFETGFVRMTAAGDCQQV